MRQHETKWDKMRQRETAWIVVWKCEDKSLYYLIGDGFTARGGTIWVTQGRSTPHPQRHGAGKVHSGKVYSPHPAAQKSQRLVKLKPSQWHWIRGQSYRWGPHSAWTDFHRVPVVTKSGLEWWFSRFADTHQELNT